MTSLKSTPQIPSCILAGRVLGPGNLQQKKSQEVTLLCGSYSIIHNRHLGVSNASTLFLPDGTFRRAKQKPSSASLRRERIQAEYKWLVQSWRFPRDVFVTLVFTDLSKYPPDEKGDNQEAQGVMDVLSLASPLWLDCG